MTQLWRGNAFRAALVPSVVLAFTTVAVVHLGIVYRQSGQPQVMYADDFRAIRALWVTAGIAISLVCVLFFSALRFIRRLNRPLSFAAATLLIIAAPVVGSFVLATASGLIYRHTEAFLPWALAPAPLQWCALLAPAGAAVLALSRRDTTGGRA